MQTKIQLVAAPWCYPEKSHPEDAGFDLKSNEEQFTLKPKEKFMVGSGVKLSIPRGYYGLVTPRSGLGSKHQIVLANLVGIIDSGYTGEIKMMLTNKGDQPIVIKQFDRVAQLIICPLPDIGFEVVKELKKSTRGDKGHGSTGK